MTRCAPSAGVVAIALTLVSCSREPAVSPAAGQSGAALPPGDRVYVTNEISGDMTIIDVRTKQSVPSVAR
jgi:YVTN family beta-propeller protein